LGDAGAELAPRAVGSRMRKVPRPTVPHLLTSYERLAKCSACMFVRAEMQLCHSPQMDGLAKSNALVFVLAATNLPWELDMVGAGRQVCMPLMHSSAQQPLAAAVCLPTTQARATVERFKAIVS